VDVNVTGTVNAIEWARRLPQVRRIVHVSTGAVYGEPPAEQSSEPQPEDGPFNPTEMYGLSKLAGEQFARRYAELFGLDLRVVRLSGVFGPMERPTPARDVMSPPHAIAEAITSGRALRVTARSLEAGGDFISSEDVADAIVRLVSADTPHHHVYNLAYGRFTALTEVFAAARSAAGGLEVVVSPDDADIDMNPANRLGAWNAYDISRAQGDLGWNPRSLEAQMQSYLAWATGPR
jgi:nucleoside-diphosphate-sugar epimerase